MTEPFVRLNQVKQGPPPPAPTTVKPWGPDLTPPKEMRDTGIEPHYHLNKVGMLEACYHKCRLGWKGWFIGITVWTIGFPLEHFLWERVPLFSDLTKWMGI